MRRGSEAAQHLSVLEVYKLKSAHYVWWRAVREYMRNHPGATASSAHLSTHMQRYLSPSLSVTERRVWMQEAEEFHAWCRLQYEKPLLDAQDKKSARSTKTDHPDGENNLCV